ncbi:hypothetical protein AMTR_s00155p00081490 [Amborella trichopoda]|uniref:Uncharacterized protein n=1 Tax=Amborella trichopoda TaxID=13333 RepID=W1PI82_AMBTC|nr:hypothetical protein AMTR_s00155p00081490 [Amborella trichopoda]
MKILDLLSLPPAAVVVGIELVVVVEEVAEDMILRLVQVVRLMPLVAMGHLLPILVICNKAGHSALHCRQCHNFTYQPDDLPTFSAVNLSTDPYVSTWYPDT